MDEYLYRRKFPDLRYLEANPQPNYVDCAVFSNSPQLNLTGYSKQASTVKIGVLVCMFTNTNPRGVTVVAIETTKQ